MKQQQQLMQQLKELMEQGNNGGSGLGNGELGKAMQDMEEIMKDLRNNTINEETFERGKKAYNKLLNHQKSTREKDKGKLWKTENFNNEELIGNDKTKNLKGNKNLEIKDLYKTLNELNQNQDITKENKNIIEEYIKILIDEKMDNNNEK